MIAIGSVPTAGHAEPRGAAGRRGVRDSGLVVEDGRPRLSFTACARQGRLDDRPAAFSPRATG